MLYMHTQHIRKTPRANLSFFFPAHKPNIYSSSDMGLNDGKTFEQFLFVLHISFLYTLL